MSAQKKSPAEPGFAESIRELEQILAGIEGEDVDLDRLSAELERAAALLELCRGKLRKAELERAATLLELCRGKLRKAELEVTEIVARLEGEDDEEAATSG